MRVSSRPFLLIAAFVFRMSTFGWAFFDFQCRRVIIKEMLRDCPTIMRLIEVKNKG